MENQHRDKILDNLDRLVEGISFDDLFNQLKSKGLFNTYMENEILVKEDIKFLYWYVTTRGPEAFSQLCEALRETNHNDLAELLLGHRPGTVRSRVIPFQNGNSSDEPSLKEEFPDNEEWKVIQSSEAFDFDRNKVYKMRSSPKGLALIINIHIYVNNTLQERLGSEKDVARLKSTLSQMGYEVIVKQDLTRDKLLDEVYEFSKDKRHWDCDSAIVVVMTHGKETYEKSSTVYLYGKDTLYINSQDLVELLSARHCDSLRGKPKIFFFQACRGDNFNYSVTLEDKNAAEVEKEKIVRNLENGDAVDAMQQRHLDTGSLQTDGVMVGKPSMVRSDSDIFIGYSTSPGMLSIRDPDTGSWYIQTLCRVFAKHAWHEDLHSMLQTVRQERNRSHLSGEDLDIGEANQGFNKALYFQPGLYDLSPPKLTNGS